MATTPTRREEIDIREEVDFVRIDPRFVERQRNDMPVEVSRLLFCLMGLRRSSFSPRSHT